MASNDRDVEITLRARDEASDEIDAVADAVEDLPDDAEVEIAADTADARSDIERLDDEIRDLSSDSQELRITFKGEQLGKEIRAALRDLERLEDPIDIETRTKDLERAQSDLRDLERLAEKEYSVEIDADPKRNARRAADDLDTVRERGEGLQSAIPALSGFAGEIDGVSSAGLGASTALADLGDFGLIASEQLGLSGGAATAAKGLGTALGAAGLAGVVVSVAIPAITLLAEKLGGSGGLSQETEDAIASLSELGGELERFQQIAERDVTLTAFLGDEDEDTIRDVGRALGFFGQEIEDLPGLLEAFSEGNREVEEQLAREAGLAPDVAAALVDVADGVDGWQDIRSRLIEDGFGDELDANEEQIRRVAAELEVLENVAEGVDLEVASEDTLRGLAAYDDAARDAYDAVRSGSVKASDALQDYLDSAEDADDATTDATDSAEDYDKALQDEADAAIAAAEEQLALADATLAAADAHRSAQDASFKLRRTENKLEEQLAKTDAILADGEATVNDKEEAVLDAVDAAADLADAEVGVRRELAKTKGETVKASDATSTFNDSMIDAAADAKGRVRDGILRYIASVNDIPPRKASRIEALIAEGKLEKAKRLLDGASRTRKAQLDAEANTREAEQDLNYTARDRTTTIKVNAEGGVDIDGDGRPDLYGLPNLGEPLPSLFGTGGEARAFASSPSGTTITSERGASGTTNNVVVNLPAGSDGRDVRRALDRWTRRNG